MAHIEWVIVCDLAYFDSHGRMCTVGITTQFVVPSLPLRMHQLMVVARVGDPRPHEEIEIGVSVTTPDGLWAVPDGPDSLQIEIASGYVLVTLRDLPLTDEGPYQFAVHLNDLPPVAVDLPVFVIPTRRHAEVH